MYRDEGWGSRVTGQGLRVKGYGTRVGIRIGFRVQDFSAGFRAQGFGCRARGIDWGT